MPLALVTLERRTPDTAARELPALRGAILVVGLGSVGQRHLRNLRTLGHPTLAAVRTGLGTRPFDGRDEVPVHRDLEAVLAAGPLAVVVANPTALHLDTALLAARAGAHVFVEKPLSHSIVGVASLLHEVRQRKLAAQVGFQLRFHPTLRQVRSWIQAGAVGRVVSAHVHWSESLRGWHPWEDYRRSYSAQSRLGGGVIRTLCHPFDYVRWLLGEVEWVAAQADRLSGLEVDVEDVALVTLRLAGGAVASVYLDYVGQPRRHRLEVVGTEGRITWEAEDGLAQLFEGSRAGPIIARPPAGFARNQLFLDEMSQFLDRVRQGGDSGAALEEGIRALEVTLAAVRAAQSGQRVHL